MIDLANTSGDQLYNLGVELGELASERPDVVHRIIIGLRDGMTQSELNSYGLGDILWDLWRHWHHDLADPYTSPPLPMDITYSGSGQGRL